MFDDFTQQANKVIILAKQEAYRLNHNFIGAENILFGLVEEEQGIASKVLKSLGVNSANIRIYVDKMISRGSGILEADAEIPLTPRAKNVLNNARTEASKLEKVKVDTEHLLLGLINEGAGICFRVMQELDVNIHHIREQVINYSNQDCLELFDNVSENTQELEQIHEENNILLTSPSLEQKIEHLTMMLQGAKQLIAEIEAEVINQKVVSYSDIVNAINKLPTSSDSQQSLKNLLVKLHSLVEADSRLNTEDKLEARYQVVILACAATKINDKYWQRKASTAIKILIGTVAQRPSDSNLLFEYRAILPVISKFWR